MVAQPLIAPPGNGRYFTRLTAPDFAMLHRGYAAEFLKMHRFLVPLYDIEAISFGGSDSNVKQRQRSGYSFAISRRECARGVR